MRTSNHSRGAGPREPSPPEVDLWLADLDALDEPPAGVLSAAERERAARIRDPGAGRRWAASRWALRQVLGEQLRLEPGAVRLTQGPHGKPALSDPQPGLDFNLSHSGGIALVALAAGPVGVDIEQVKPRRNLEALAARALSAAEAEEIAAAKGKRQVELFFAAWTRHEARLKCHGGGLGRPPSEGPVAVAQLELGPGYAGAVAVAGERPPLVRLQRLELR